MTVAAPRVGFIAGWGRSGSTLLERLLARHPDVTSVGEMRDIWQRGVLENRLCGCGVPFRSCEFWSAVGAQAFGGWDNIDAAAMARTRRRVDGLQYMPWLVARGTPSYERRRREMTAALGRLYGAIGRVSGARVVVDASKIPTYAMLLRRAGMDLRVMHLVRDSRGVVFSWQKHKERKDSTAGSDYMRQYSTSGASARYVAHNLATRVLPRLGTPYVLLRYEDLVSNPAEALYGALELLDVNQDFPILGRDDPGLVALEVSHSVDGNPMRFARGAVPLKLDSEWRLRMSPRDVRTVTALTYPLLRGYGYSTAMPGRALERRTA